MHDAIEKAARARVAHRFCQDYGMRREYMDCMCGERILVLGADDPWDVFEQHRAEVCLLAASVVIDCPADWHTTLRGRALPEQFTKQCACGGTGRLRIIPNGAT